MTIRSFNRTKGGMEFEITDSSGLAGDRQQKDFDYHIRKENGQYVVDTFDGEIDNSDEAHLGSDEFATCEEAIEFVMTDGRRYGIRG